MLKTPIICNLDAQDMGDRTGEWNTLLLKATNYQRTQDGVKVTFAKDINLREYVQDLAKREKACCPFFVFTFTDTDNGFQLSATAPPDAQFKPEGLR